MNEKHKKQNLMIISIIVVLIGVLFFSLMACLCTGMLVFYDAEQSSQSESYEVDIN